MNIIQVNERSKSYFLIGFFLVMVAGITLVIQSLTLYLNAKAGWWQFPLALLFTLALQVFAVSKSPWQLQAKPWKIAFTIALPLVLTGISLLIAGFFFDVSDDGQEYHQETIIQLAQGWNPYHTVLGENKITFLKDVKDGWDPYKMGINYRDIYFVWINHYAKGAESIQAAIYATTGHIETGKALNIMLMLGGLFLSLSALLPLLSSVKAWTISLLLMCNPISISQMLTFCVDGALASLLLLLVISIRNALRVKHMLSYALVLMVIILIFGVKFSGVVYAVITIILIVCWLFLKGELLKHKSLIFTMLLASVLGILAGFNPYITNTLKHGHPFYPLMGKTKVDIVTLNSPPGFSQQSMPRKLFVSLFSHTDNISVSGTPADYPQLKLPLTLKMVDLKSFWRPDVRVAGFGPWFSGIIIIALVMLAIFIARGYRDRRFKDAIFILGTLLLTVAIMPESWWARYIPQLWYIPIFLLLAFELILPAQRKWLRNSLYFALIVNVSFSSIVIIQNAIISTQIKYQLAVLEASKERILIDFHDSPPLRARLREHGIPYNEVAIKTTNGATEIFKRSSSEYYIPKHVSTVQPPLLLRLLSRLQVKLNPIGGLGN